MRLQRRRPQGDAGFSLVEMVAGMTVMGVFMAIFTGSMVMMFRSSNHSQAVTHTAQQVNSAFMWLDSEIRYADYVAAPGQVGADHGNWYVEFERTDQTTHDHVCHQLRIDQSAEQLQQRSWTGNGAASNWQPLASGVTNGGTSPGSDSTPFVRIPVGQDQPATPGRAAIPGLPSMQLTVNLTTVEGAGPGAATSQSSVTFAAFNTDKNSQTSGICTGKRP